MSQAGYFRTLASYNGWANEKILQAAVGADEADYFAQTPGLSFGSLHATLVHALVADIVWLARFEGRLPPEEIKDARTADRLAVSHFPAFADVRRAYAENMARQDRFFATLTDEQSEAQLSYKTQYGEPNTQPLNELIGHYINHATQFRSEAAVRLSQLGCSPGDLDLIIFLRQRSWVDGSARVASDIPYMKSKS
jgi:uncharacterized damage-inducible protein DinB